MAERKTFSRYNMRCGMILRASTAGVALDGFELPDTDSRFLALTAEELGESNDISISGLTVPLLASKEILWPGQPLMVLFGPDYESTELALEKVKVKTHPLEKTEEEDDASFPDPLFFSWGLEDGVENEKGKLKKTESLFEMRKGPIPIHTRHAILSWEDSSNTLHVQCPMQWCTVVKEAVSRALQRSPETILLHPMKYTSKSDEHLFAPAFYAAYTAVATTITKIPCEMREKGSAERSGLRIHTATWTDEDGRPKHEEINVTIDQGALTLFGKEVQRQTIAGLIPEYNLESFKIMIRTEKSHSAPSAFCGSSLFSAAVSSRALHMARISSRMGKTPASYTALITKDTTKFTDWAPKHDLQDLVSKVKTGAAQSDFDRKWSASALRPGDFGLHGYLYGIGLSHALSMAGFSTSTAKDNQFISQLTYTLKRNITVSGYFPQTLTQNKNLREAISAPFQGDGKNGEAVLFLDGMGKIPDSGPDILSSYSSVFATQLMKAAQKLAQLIREEGNEPPLTMKFNAQNLAFPCEFEYSGYGSAVMEIRIPKTSLVPEVTSIRINAALALPYSKGVREKIKSTALSTLSSLGVRTSDDFTLSVILTSEKKEVTTLSSPENLVRALTASSLTAALWQAMGARSSVALPFDPRDLEMTKSGGKE